MDKKESEKAEQGKGTGERQSVSVAAVTMAEPNKALRDECQDQLHESSQQRSNEDCSPPPSPTGIHQVDSSDTSLTSSLSDNTTSNSSSYPRTFVDLSGDHNSVEKNQQEETEARPGAVAVSGSFGAGLKTEKEGRKLGLSVNAAERRASRVAMQERSSRVEQEVTAADKEAPGAFAMTGNVAIFGH